MKLCETVKNAKPLTWHEIVALEDKYTATLGHPSVVYTRKKSRFRLDSRKK